MGRYALNDGLLPDVATPLKTTNPVLLRHAAAARRGVMVALADKLETLVGMFGIKATCPPATKTVCTASAAAR
jgi:glycyl-tRNA synthetase beta subunit